MATQKPQTQMPQTQKSQTQNPQTGQPYQCTGCGNSFPSQKELQDHKKTCEKCK